MPNIRLEKPARPRAGEIAAMLADRAESLATYLVGNPPELRERLSVRYRENLSLRVHTAGDRKGKFYDYAEEHGGDSLDFICHLRRCSTSEALRWALAWLGIDGGPDGHRPAPAVAARNPTPQANDSGLNVRELCRTTWVESKKLKNTWGAAYFLRRVGHVPRSDDLRFHPACPCGSGRLPAVVALMRNPLSGEPCGIHRTFLIPGGLGKAAIKSPKMMLGAAGVICLSSPEDVTYGIGIVEGIENGLSVIHSIGWRPIWACCSAGGISRFPVLPGFDCITVGADPDPTGQAAARKCCDRWVAAGREAAIETPPDDLDWNDRAQGDAA